MCDAEFNAALPSRQAQGVLDATCKSCMVKITADERARRAVQPSTALARPPVHGVDTRPTYESEAALHAIAQYNLNVQRVQMHLIQASWRALGKPRPAWRPYCREKRKSPPPVPKKTNEKLLALAAAAYDRARDVDPCTSVQCFRQIKRKWQRRRSTAAGKQERRRTLLGQPNGHGQS